MASSAQLLPVILSGGSGQRLWPLSRKSNPKQLHAILSDQSLLQQTALRLRGSQFADPFVICSALHRFQVAEQLRCVGISPLKIMLEPVGRNTAAACAVAAIAAQRFDPKVVVGVFPSDHLIDGGSPTFYAAIEAARKAASDASVVLIGIRPDGPKSGLGYIVPGATEHGAASLDVSRFVEKPDIKTAASLVKEGALWNAGMFVFRPDIFLEEMREFCPDIVRQCERAVDLAEQDLDFLRLDRNALEACPSQSIDRALVEKTKTARVVPADVSWRDVGTWPSIWQASEHDANNNAVTGPVVLSDVSNSLIRTDGPVVAAVGLTDIVVVAAADAVLVSSINGAQGIGDLYADLDAMGATTSPLVFRPWGTYETLDQGPGFLVKRLTVNPKGILSLQRHQRRAEHWVVVEGVARVTRGEKTFILRSNESTYIPLGTTHRLENPDPENELRIIEVQTGSYLHDDDIERFDDAYGRRVAPLDSEPGIVT